MKLRLRKEFRLQQVLQVVVRDAAATLRGLNKLWNLDLSSRSSLLNLVQKSVQMYHFVFTAARHLQRVAGKLFRTLPSTT